MHIYIYIYIYTVTSSMNLSILACCFCCIVVAVVGFSFFAQVATASLAPKMFDFSLTRPKHDTKSSVYHRVRGWHEKMLKNNVQSVLLWAHVCKLNRSRTGDTILVKVCFLVPSADSSCVQRVQEPILCVLWQILLNALSCKC